MNRFRQMNTIIPMPISFIHWDCFNRLMNQSRRNSIDKGSESSTIVGLNDTASEIHIDNEAIPMAQHPGFYYSPSYYSPNEYRYSMSMYPYKSEIINMPTVQSAPSPPYLIPMPRNRQTTPKSMPPFDKCPIIFSLLSLCLCPVTCCCSLPAFVFSMCSYVDHRVRDAERFRINSDHAKRLIIVACILGLLLVVLWSIFVYIYKDHILRILSDHIKLLNSQISGWLEWFSIMLLISNVIKLSKSTIIVIIIHFCGYLSSCYTRNDLNIFVFVCKLLIKYLSSDFEQRRKSLETWKIVF